MEFIRKEVLLQMLLDCDGIQSISNSAKREIIRELAAKCETMNDSQMAVRIDNFVADMRKLTQKHSDDVALYLESLKQENNEQTEWMAVFDFLKLKIKTWCWVYYPNSKIEMAYYDLDGFHIMNELIGESILPPRLIYGVIPINMPKNQREVDNG